MAKVITGIEICLSFIPFLYLGYLLFQLQYFTNINAETLGPFVIYWAYLATEFIGIHKKIRGLIIFSCLIRVILSVLDGLAIMAILFVVFDQSSKTYFLSRDYISRIGAYLVIYFFVTVPTMPYLIFRTWIQFKVFRADSDDATLNITAQLQPIPTSL